LTSGFHAARRWVPVHRGEKVVILAFFGPNYPFYIAKRKTFTLRSSVNATQKKEKVPFHKWILTCRSQGYSPVHNSLALRTKVKAHQPRHVCSNFEWTTLPSRMGRCLVQSPLTQTCHLRICYQKRKKVHVQRIVGA
jgi:hypothetical protein